MRLQLGTKFVFLEILFVQYSVPEAKELTFHCASVSVTIQSVVGSCFSHHVTVIYLKEHICKC